MSGLWFFFFGIFEGEGEVWDGMYGDDESFEQDRICRLYRIDRLLNEDPRLD